MARKTKIENGVLEVNGTPVPSGTSAIDEVLLTEGPPHIVGSAESGSDTDPNNVFIMQGANVTGQVTISTGGAIQVVGRDVDNL